jgi:glycosyltransferase involved in cell wall biosynthesis
MLRAFRAYLITAAVLLPCFLLSEAKICLTMVVKNEEASIPRCLESVKNIIDCISITDAGSTDNTISLIKQFMQKTGIPGKITDDPWHDFSHNRTQSVRAAQKTLNELGFPLQETYLLILDADMSVETMSAFKKNELEADSYLLPEESIPLSCFTFKTRLLRASIDWEYKGSMCGSWNCLGPRQEAKLLTLSVKERGNCDLTQQNRNIEFLEKALKDDPGNTCLTLQLAHLHRSRRHFDEAILHYKTRIGQGGEKEEIWFSYYLIGKCQEDLGDWNQACQSYFRAYEFDPHRSEPLLKVAMHYRIDSQNNIAYLFAKPGSLIHRAQDQILFDASPVYDYRFAEELSISAYYTKFKEDGYTAASALVTKKNVPWNVKDQAYKNLLFYVPNLKCSRYLPIQIELPFIRPDNSERYHPMNPLDYQNARWIRADLQNRQLYPKRRRPTEF